MILVSALSGGGARNADGGFERLNDGAFWFYPLEQYEKEMRASCGSTNASETRISSGFQSKISGFSVRCVMVE